MKAQPSGPRASNSVTKDLADIWPFKADYEYDDVKVSSNLTKKGQ